MNVIKIWFVSNGTMLNAIYAGVLLFSLLSIFMAINNVDAQSRKSHADSVETGIGLFALASIFAVPSVLLYAFDGMGEHGELMRLAPKPFAELLWFHKIVLIAFVVFFLIFVLVIGIIDRDPVCFWNTMAIEGILVVLCTLFMLLERGLNALFPNSLLFGLAFLAVHGFLQLYSYLALIFTPAVAVLSPFIMLIPGTKNAVSSHELTAEEKYAEHLDTQERVVNSALGIGYLTDDEALIAGKIDTSEWTPGSILREQKMDKFKKG